MNGYLNNLTMRTLNTGNRVEPRLPAMFEPSAFESGLPAAERFAPFEEEETTVSEAAPGRVRTEERASAETSSHGPRVAKPEDSPAKINAVSSAVKSDGDLEPRFEPVSHEEEREEDSVETLTVQASLQPRTETVEVPTPVNDPVAQTAPSFEGLEERLIPSLEIDDSALLRPKTRSESQNSPVTSHRIPRRNPPARPAALSPPPTPATDSFQTKITFRRTTPPETMEPPVTPIELAPNQETAERQVTENPEPEFETTTQSTYRRVNPTLATWRDTRQQQWRRRQSPVPLETEPSINVTIGRIEVRAVPADNRKTTSPRRSESPVLPLEDYLRKQRRGER